MWSDSKILGICKNNVKILSSKLFKVKAFIVPEFVIQHVNHNYLCNKPFFYFKNNLKQIVAYLSRTDGNDGQKKQLTPPK